MNPLATKIAAKISNGRRDFLSAIAISVVRHRARYSGFRARDLHLFARAREQSID
jgi:hypothetical protein